jgi:hypothetical protein
VEDHPAHAHKSNETFKSNYARAREGLMDFYAEQVLAISFDESGDIIIEQDGDKSKAVANHVKVQRDRLKVDSLKWTASRLFPKRYGDKMELLGMDGSSGELVLRWETGPTEPPPIAPAPRVANLRAPQTAGRLIGGRLGFADGHLAGSEERAGRR